MRCPPPRRVLLVMINHHLGDFVIALPALSAICHSYPCPVDILVDSRYAELARLSAPFSKVIPHDQSARRDSSWTRRAADFWRTVKQLPGRYDLVLDVGGGIRSSTLALLTFARRRVGLEGRRRAWTYSTRLARGTIVHQRDLYRPMLAFAGAMPVVNFTLRPPAQASEHLRDQLRCIFGRKPRELAVIHPGAGHAHRCWPSGNFGRLARKLVVTRDWDVIVIGTVSERHLLASVVDASGRSDRVKPLIPSLTELLALFATARLLVSNESGPTHLAATTPIPIVTLFGPSNETRWRPSRDRALRILRGQVCLPACTEGACPNRYACVRSITVEQVEAACAELML